MPKTFRENYGTLLAALHVDEELLRQMPNISIVFDGGDFTFDPGDDLFMAAFILKLERGRRGSSPIVLGLNERVALIRYVTDDIYYDAREHPHTKYQALRALLQPGAVVRMAGHSALA